MLIAFAYICGSIPVGVIVGKLCGFDPRTVGSGNVGMTNVARAGGASAAAATFVGDLCKGLLPVLLARAMIGVVPTALAPVGFATLIGSTASIFLGFKGGQGVATSFGVWLGLAPVAVVIVLGLFIATLTISRIVSLASLAAAISLPATVAATHSPRPYILLAIVMSAMVVWRHRANIQRLLAGDERRIGGPPKG